MERKEILIVLLIGALLLTTAIQTVALVGMNSRPASIVQANSAPAQSSSGSPVVSTGSLNDLPSMVGGC
ncbi:MAG: hypothetical protein QXU88_00125 [Candidatus Woesearchaeota archaeon]